jgi:hypothetical protein
MMRILPMGLLMVVFSAACGDSGGDGSGDPGTTLTDSKKLSDLSDAEQGALCDWVANVYGGYGKSVTCSNGTNSSSEASRQVCLSRNIASCSATVGDVKACTLKAHEICLEALSDSACEAFLSCLVAG